MTKSEGPTIITEEKGARAEFIKLTEFGFTVYQVKALTKEEFAEALQNGQGVWINQCQAGGTVDLEFEREVIEKGKINPQLTYDELIETGYCPYLPEAVDEDRFVEIAASEGSVALQRVRGNGKTMRTTGTRIGYSNSPSQIYPIKPTPLQ